MTKLQISNADVVVTMDADRREIAGGTIAIENGVIASVGASGHAGDCDETLDARGCVVTPGLISACATDVSQGTMRT